MSRKFKAWGAFAIVLVMVGVANANSSGHSDTSSEQSSVSSSVNIKQSASNESSAANSNDQSSSIKHHVQNKDKPIHKSKHAKRQHQASELVTSLAAKNYHSGDAAYINVNGGNSTLKAGSWQTNHIDYANLDSLNRTTNANTAYLESRNVANDSLRTSQTVYPTGWHQKFINNEAIINRGHMIAYSLSKGISVDGNYEPSLESGDQNNPKNLFTQTAFSNQRVQTIYESKVRSALRNGEHVIYQVQPIFRGNELMARGVHLQAISTDGSLNFNVYLFNVQPGIQFDYATGRSTVDNNMDVPMPAGAPTFNDYRRNYYHHSTAKTALGAYGAYRIYRYYHHRHYHPYTHYYHRHYSYHRSYFQSHYRQHY